MGSAKELTLILVLLIGAWSISAVAGTLSFWLLVASLIWIVIQLREYRKIQRWSERPLSRPANAFDSWFWSPIAPSDHLCGNAREHIPWCVNCAKSWD